MATDNVRRLGSLDTDSLVDHYRSVRPHIEEAAAYCLTLAPAECLNVLAASISGLTAMMMDIMDELGLTPEAQAEGFLAILADSQALKEQVKACQPGRLN